MSFQDEMRSRGYVPVSDAAVDARLSFIRKTYLHLTGAVFAFAALLAAWLMIPFGDTSIAGAFTRFVFSFGSMGWLAVLLAFSGVGYLADSWAQSDRGPAMQYAGLGVYVLIESIIFMPIMFIAANFSDPSVIPIAGGLTLIVFAGLTVSVFMTKADFSWMRTGLVIAGFLAFGVIGLAAVFGFTLGLFFSIAMVVFAAASILYYTSNVLHHYRTDQHVAAALALFSAVALLFFYILRLVMAFGRD
jgi:hypothetical protein